MCKSAAVGVTRYDPCVLGAFRHKNRLCLLWKLRPISAIRRVGISSAFSAGLGARATFVLPPTFEVHSTIKPIGRHPPNRDSSQLTTASSRPSSGQLIAGALRHGGRGGIPSSPSEGRPSIHHPTNHALPIQSDLQVLIVRTVARPAVVGQHYD